MLLIYYSLLKYWFFIQNYQFVVIYAICFHTDGFVCLSLFYDKLLKIQGIFKASAGVNRFSGFHSNVAFKNSIKSGSSCIFKASARVFVDGYRTLPRLLGTKIGW